MKRLNFLLVLLAAMNLTLNLEASTEKKVGTSDKKEDSDKTKDSVEKKDDAKKEEEEEPPKIGNFALPTSQQPGPLFGFGQNIIDNKETQIYFFADGFYGRDKITTDLIPSLLYGISDDLSIYFNFPINPRLRDGLDKSYGKSDFFLQLEYAFINSKTKTHTNQATLVGNVTFPTGSIKKNPQTGFGSSSIFVGLTYNRTYVDWMGFTSQGAIVTMFDGRNKIGNQYIYQCGIARNIPSPPDRIYAFMLELDGQYYERNIIKGKIDHSSGGNIVLITPSLWFSNKRQLLQFGISFPVAQHWFGEKRKFNWVFNINWALSFYSDDKKK